MTTYRTYPQGYYVYAYLRNKDSKNGKEGTPYYIGKGKSSRAWNHHGRVPVPKDSKYLHIIQDNLGMNESYDLEIRLIRWYGRIDSKTGILQNRTDGGDGSRGAVVSEATREKMSTSHSNKPEEILKKYRGRTGEKNSFYGKTHSEETKAKLRESRKNQTTSVETKQKISASNMGKKKPGNAQHCAELGRQHKGKKWWNNGIDEKMSFDQPDTLWSRGRLSTSVNGFSDLNKNKSSMNLRWWFNGDLECQTERKPGDDWSPGRSLKK